MDKILLIDGHNQLWRACVKFGPSPDDAPDHEIFTFNFFRNIRSLIQDLSPDKCFMVMEGHPQFRYDIFPSYKGNRIIKLASKKESSDSFNKMRELTISLMKHLPITLCKAEAYEADDVIATLTDSLKNEDVTILSSDSDFIQLLQKGYPNLRIYNPIKKVDMEAPAYSYIAWKCLAGDKSDNIPGLLKPKKVMDAITHPDVFAKFLSQEENRANFCMNRNLIEFRMVPEEEIVLTEGVKNFDKLKEEFTELKFSSLINDVSWERFKATFNTIKF